MRLGSLVTWLTVMGGCSYGNIYSMCIIIIYVFVFPGSVAPDSAGMKLMAAVGHLKDVCSKTVSASFCSVFGVCHIQGSCDNFHSDILFRWWYGFTYKVALKYLSTSLDYFR